MCIGMSALRRINPFVYYGHDLQCRQRARAITLIQRHAGGNAAEAQKTKWVVDLVIKMDLANTQSSEQAHEEVVRTTTIL